MKKKETTTSKILALTVLRMWVLVVIFSCVALWFNRDANGILIAVSGSLGIVLTDYFTKSYFENKEKYKTKEESYDYQTDEETM